MTLTRLTHEQLAELRLRAESTERKAYDRYSVSFDLDSVQCYDWMRAMAVIRRIDRHIKGTACAT